MAEEATRSSRSWVWKTALVLAAIRITLYVDSFADKHKLLNGSETVVHTRDDVAQTVRFEQEVGNYGTTFVAVIQLEGTAASLVKGYVLGSTGANISVGGQALGMGISTPEFWLEKQRAGREPDDPAAYSVFVNFNVIKFLILNDRMTMRIGKLVVKGEVPWCAG